MSLSNILLVSDDQLTRLVQSGLSVSSILKTLGIKPSFPGARAVLKSRLQILGLHVLVNQQRRTYTLDQFKQALQTASCWSDVCKSLNLTVCGHNYIVLKRYAQQNSIELPVFDVKQTLKRGKKQYTFDEIYCENSQFSRQVLNKKTKQLNPIPYCCEKCSNTGVWNDEVLGLELDHKNGIHDDNRLGNLRWLCPNCHSQTSTYKGKNIQIPEIEEIKVPKTKVVRTSVFDKSSKEELQQLLKEQSMEQIGRIFGVTGAAVKRHCIKLGIIIPEIKVSKASIAKKVCDECYSQESIPQRKDIIRLIMEESKLTYEGAASYHQKYRSDNELAYS